MIMVEGMPVIPTIFPDKTSQVWKLDESVFKRTQVKIEWDFESESEIMHLAQLMDLLEAHSVKASLSVNYLPYARQDKVISNTTTSGLFTFAKLLNMMKFEYVTCIDPHSEVPNGVIKNFLPRDPVVAINDAINAVNPDIICYPDQGAFKRYTSFIKYPHIHALKKRNQITGIIEGTELIGNPSGLRVLIVDDICDGGATFINLAKMLYEHGATEVNLYATHGIFSKGVEHVKSSGIKQIYTRKGAA